MIKFFSNIFNKFKRTKIVYKILIILGIFLYAFLMFITTKNVNVIATYPGYISPVNNFVNVDAEFEKGNFYTTSVLQNRKISLIEYWIHQNNFFVDVQEYDPALDLTTAEDHTAGVYYKKNSIAKALIAGYLTASNDDISTSIDFEYKGIRVTSIDKTFDNRLKVGDLIIQLNEIDLIDFNQTKSIIGELNDGHFSSEGSYIPLKVVRDSVTLDIVSPVQLLSANLYGIGIYGEAYYEVNEATPNFEVVDNFSSTGPSGGLMQTLYVYDSLTLLDLTSGLKVAGTGTIEIVYNEDTSSYQFSVGKIGGVKQKILTANKNKVDVFFIPSSNYSEALEVYNKLKKPTFKLVSVTTLNEAIEWLEGVANE